MEVEEDSTNQISVNAPVTKNITGIDLNLNANQCVIRPCARTKKPRFRWTDDLHHRFIDAIMKLGGEDRATPKLILKAMDVDGVTVSNVKSHLQMYRCMQQELLIQVVKDNAKKNEKDKQLVAKIPELLYSSSHPVRRRQSHLQRLKALLITNSQEKHFPVDREMRPPSPPLTEYSDVTVVDVPGCEGKVPHEYIIFNDLLKSADSISTKEKAKIKGKEKMNEMDEHDDEIDPRVRMDFLSSFEAAVKHDSLKLSH